MTPKPPVLKGLGDVLAPPDSIPWFRGPFRIEGEYLVLEVGKAEVYQLPMNDQRVSADLMRVETALDAQAFAGRFGLLTLFPEPERDDAESAFYRGTLQLFLDAEPGGPLRGVSRPLPPPLGLREDSLLRERRDDTLLRGRIDDILLVARSLNGIVRKMFSVRRAASGNKKDIAALRTEFGYADFVTDQDLIEEQGHIQARHLDRVLRHLPGRVLQKSFGESGAVPGHIRLGLQPTTLKELCYLQVALLLADGVEMSECEECGRVFEVHDGRQRFCRASCSSKGRQRRFMANREARSVTQTKRIRKGVSGDGKTTRKR